MRCYPMADSQLILELMFLHIRGGCSLAVLLFFLMLVGTCCFILSANQISQHLMPRYAPGKWAVVYCPSLPG